MQARLLVVDDEEMNRDLLSRRLQYAGHHVEVAASGYEALEMMAAAAFDMVLLDLMMPGLSGLEVLEEIRKTHSAAVLPVIMVTAEPASQSVSKALRLGANDYITKPVDFVIAKARIDTRLELAAAARELGRKSELYRLASCASEEGLWDWDMVNGRVFYSPRWKSMLGYSDEEISTGTDEFFSRLHPDCAPDLKTRLAEHVDGRSPTFDCDFRMLAKDGSYCWMNSRGTVSRDAAGRAIRMAGTQTDITARKTIDGSTGLRNRIWLEDSLEQARARNAAVLVFDLNDFQTLQESVPGVSAAAFLAATGGRLRDCLAVQPESERAVAVRSGEDQFAVLLWECGSLEEAKGLASRLRTGLQDPLVLGGETVFVTATVGIAMASRDDSAGQLLRNAQAAGRHAREQGTRASGVFHKDMRQHNVDEFRLENDLRQAVERGEFVVHYQPKVDLEDYSIQGMEALVRWNRPGRGLVMPNDFIPIAERGGLIVSIGRQVLEQACRETAALRRISPDLEVSVNVSGRQFEQTDLVEQVREVLAVTGLPGNALRLEITETVLIGDSGSALVMLRRLRDMGVGLKLDDFGSGYSSLSYLQQFPFDTLKIDRSFVTAAANGEEGTAIVRTIVSLAHSLHLSVVAEGIESESQAEMLRGMGCRYGQGYWFSRPVDLNRFRELLHLGTLPAQMAPVQELSA